MNKYEEIKEKYLKSNKYCLLLDYEDIGMLIHIIETLNQFNKQEVASNKELRNRIENKIKLCKLEKFESISESDKHYKYWNLFEEILKSLL